MTIIQGYSSGNLLFSPSLPWELSNQAAHLEMAHRTQQAPGVNKHFQSWHRNHRSNQARCSLVLYDVHTVPILKGRLLKGRFLSSHLHVFSGKILSMCINPCQCGFPLDITYRQLQNSCRNTSLCSSSLHRLYSPTAIEQSQTTLKKYLPGYSNTVFKEGLSV